MKIEDVQYVINQITDESTRRAITILVEKIIEELDTKADE